VIKPQRGFVAGNHLQGDGLNAGHLAAQRLCLGNCSRGNAPATQRRLHKNIFQLHHNGPRAL